MVGRSAADPRLGAEELALQPWAPAASVFKVVSAAALVAEGGVSGATRTCYHGGVSVDPPRQPRRHPAHRPPLRDAGLRPRQVAERDPRQARAAATSTAAQLARVGHAFGFGETIPFDVPVEPSHLDVPGRRARVRAYRGRLLALDAVADARRAAGGDDREPGRDAGADARRAAPSAPRAALALPVGGAPRRVVRPRRPREVGQHDGADHAHRHRQGDVPRQEGPPLSARRRRRARPARSSRPDRPRLPRLQLVRGYAPADHPQIAFAVALGNHAGWRIKATYVGRRIVTSTWPSGRRTPRPAPRSSPPAESARVASRAAKASAGISSADARDVGRTWRTVRCCGGNCRAYRLAPPLRRPCPEQCSFIDWLSTVATDRGSGKALVYRDTYLSWRGLSHRVDGAPRSCTRWGSARARGSG